MEKEYTIDCPICDHETIVHVLYSEEPPAHCPMCGSDAEPESTSDEEQL